MLTIPDIPNLKKVKASWSGIIYDVERTILDKKKNIVGFILIAKGEKVSILENQFKSFEKI